ncbi:MAG: hypothetical protein ABNH16_11550 [Thalassolituus sp.]|jgi:hypothetical protein
MSLFKKRVSPYLLVTPLVLALSSCSDSNNSSKTNPDFNQDVIFTDYGTYGRTIYFDDDEGSTWCYYDILTMNNSKELKLTISTPIKFECHLDKSLYLTTEYISITGEEKNGSNDFNLSTTTTESEATYLIYPSNGDFSESNTEYQNARVNIINPNPLAPFITLGPYRSGSTVATLRISNINGGYFSNRISINDYWSVNGLVNSETTVEEAIEDVIKSNSLLISLLSDGDELPVSDLPYTLLGRPENREELYTAHPYQRLTPTEDDPYPLIQVRVE